MRCVVTEIGSDREHAGEKDAEFLGLMYEEDRGGETDIVAVVRLPGHGLFVQSVHPSRVRLIEP